jgi:hypothetical protein
MFLPKVDMQNNNKINDWNLSRVSYEIVNDTKDDVRFDNDSSIDPEYQRQRVTLKSEATNRYTEEKGRKEEEDK